MTNILDDVDPETKEFFHLLYQLAPTQDEILSTMRDGRWFQVSLLSKHTRLTNDEKMMWLDTNFVDWAGFGIDILYANAIHRATSLENCPPRTKKLTATKLKIISSFQVQFCPDSVRGNIEKMGTAGYLVSATSQSSTAAFWRRGHCANHVL